MQRAHNRAFALDSDSPQQHPGALAHDAEERAPAITAAEFEAALAPLMPRLYRFCLALCRDAAEADDVLQEGLVRAFLNVHSFQGSSELFGWLCGVLRNQFIELRRTAARRRSILENIVLSCSPVLDQLFGGGAASPSPEEATSLGEESSRLLAALRQLPEDFRTVVLLHDIEGLGYDEIALVVKAPLGTVKSRHARGRARLLEAFGQEPPASRRTPEGSSP